MRPKGSTPKGFRPVDGTCRSAVRAIRDVKVDPRLKFDDIRFCEDCQLESVRASGRRAEVQWRTQWEACRGWYEGGWEGLSKKQLMKVFFRGALYRI